MKFTLKIDLDNDYFVDDAGEVDTCNLARIIHKVSRQVRETIPTPNAFGSVHDGNGNTIGHWEIK